MVRKVSLRLSITLTLVKTRLMLTPGWWYESSSPMHLRYVYIHVHTNNNYSPLFMHTVQFKVDVEATEVALAFPLSSDMKTVVLAKVTCFFSPPHSLYSSNTSILQDLQHQQVFAFLPLRSYGFRFIVQGDFDLPSSREDVNRDSAWNQWIRDEIPQLFLHAIEKIKVHSL